jgi:hypothetical protein
MPVTKSGKDVRAHTVYKNRDGKRVPAVTTITGILDKPGLVNWAWNLGMQGIDHKTYVDDKKEVGTLIHRMILEHLGGEKVDRSLVTPAQLEMAEVAFNKYLLWENLHEVKPILLEQPLVSEQHQYGGTPDNLCLLDGRTTLIDYKTGKGIYPEMMYQVAAYAWLLTEHGYINGPHSLRILRIGRDEDEGFEDREVNGASELFQVFLHCLKIYSLKKQLKIR